jgi:hypothetical protein
VNKRREKGRTCERIEQVTRVEGAVRIVARVVQNSLYNHTCDHNSTITHVGEFQVARANFWTV